MPFTPLFEFLSACALHADRWWVDARLDHVEGGKCLSRRIVPPHIGGRGGGRGCLMSTSVQNNIEDILMQDVVEGEMT